MQGFVLLILPVFLVPKKRSLPRRKTVGSLYPYASRNARLVATDAEAAFNGDPAAQNINEVIFCYPGFRAVCNYRIAHQLYRLGVPFIPRMITEMAHSETGIDIHPGAEIGHYFSIDHGTGTVIGETSVIGNHVRIFQGVSLAGEKLPPDENGNAIRGVPRHPVLGDHVTVYSNATLLGVFVLAKELRSVATSGSRKMFRREQP